MSLSRKAVGAALVAAIGAGAILFSGGGVVHGQAQPPTARIFGSITINGQNAPSGAVVTAYGTNNALCGTSSGQGVYNGTQYYVDIDSSNPSCSQAGITLSFKVNGQAATTTTTVPDTPGSAVQLNIAVSGQAGPSSTVTYQPGWNIVGGPTGQTFTQAGATLYTAQAGDTAYEQMPNTSPITAPRGYWAFFSAATTVTIQGAAPTGPTTIAAPAGTYIMVGNPNPTATVTVSGQDVMFTFNPTSNSYAISTTLAPGQGGVIYSAAGATITIQ